MIKFKKNKKNKRFLSLVMVFMFLFAFSGIASADTPDTVQNVEAEADGTSVDITWDEVTNDNLDGYKVYRDGEEIADVDGTSYQDLSLEEETTYEYTVVAYDEDGDESDESSVTEVTTGEMGTLSALDFNVEPVVDDIGESVSDSLGSMTPIFLIPAGLIVAAAILSWGISMLKRFNASGGRRKEY